MANVLPFDKQVSVIAALCEGVSIRATERLVDVNRGTIMSLGVRVGMGCAALHDSLMRNVRVSLLEFDEVWSYIGKKQKRLTAADAPEKGDCYIFTALDATGKAIISYRVGKRTAEHTVAFAADVRARVLDAPQISSALVMTAEQIGRLDEAKEGT